MWGRAGPTLAGKPAGTLKMTLKWLCLGDFQFSGVEQHVNTACANSFSPRTHLLGNKRMSIAENASQLDGVRDRQSPADDAPVSQQAGG